MMKLSTVPTTPKQLVSERRKAVRLLQYWEEIRADHVFPSENDIDPEAIADIWDNCFLLQVRDMYRTDGNFTYLGRNIIEAFRGGLSGDACGELVSPNIRNLGQNFTDILQKLKPQVQVGEFRNIKGGLVRYRQALVPLGHQKDAADAIFGCMALKVFHDQ